MRRQRDLEIQEFKRKIKKEIYTKKKRITRCKRLTFYTLSNAIPNEDCESWSIRSEESYDPDIVKITRLKASQMNRRSYSNCGT